MTREDIIRMAREAGFSEVAIRTPQDLKRFAALVAAAEREACAKVAAEHECYLHRIRFDSMPSDLTRGRMDGERSASFDIAAAIRARDKK
jgi:hypothetical protein